LAAAGSDLSGYITLALVVITIAARAWAYRKAGVIT